MTKPTCPAFSAWLNIGAIRSLKVTGKAIMLCSYGINIKVTCRTNVGSMCDCKPCRSLDLAVLLEILSGVDSDHGTGPRRNRSVNSRSTICPIERRHADQRRSFKPLAAGCLCFANWTISSCLTSQTSKLY